MSRFIIKMLCLLCFSVSVFGQEYGHSQFRTMDIKDGLPSLQINAIAQDKVGYIWLATKDGLARFDGKSYKVFRHTPGDEQSLPSNFVNVVHVDSANRVWVAIEGFGLYVLNANQTGFEKQKLLINSNNEALDIWAIVSDAQGSVWLGTFGQGLFRIKLDGVVQHYSPNSMHASLPDENVLSLALDKNSVLWIATSSGIVKWKDEKFIAFDNRQLTSKVVINLMPDAESGMWLGTKDGLNFVDEFNQASVPEWRAQLSGTRVMALLHEDNGARWFICNKGISRLYQGQVQNYFSQNDFLSGFKDSDGGFWFGGNQRLMMQPKAWRNFSTLTNLSSNGISRNSTLTGFARQTDGSFLLIGHEGFIDRYSPPDGKITPIAFVNPAGPGRDLRSVLRDSSGNLWLGGGLELLRISAITKNTQLWNTESKTDAALLGPVRQLMQTTDGLIWMSFYGGGIQARDETGRVIHSITPKSQQGLRFPDPEQLFIGPDAQLWLVGGEGVLRWDPILTAFIPVNGAPSIRMHSAFLDKDELWLGGLGELIQFTWNAKNKYLQRIKRYAGDQQIPAIEISSIHLDPNKIAWFGTSRGIVKYDIENKSARIYGINDGLLSQEFDLATPLQDVGNASFMLSKNGLVQFDKRKLIAENIPLRLVLERASIRRDEDEINLNSQQKIVLQPGDRDLSIDALLLSFDDVSTHRYRSKLNGYDPDWVEMGAVGTRVFSTLPNGNYTLEIIASNAEGNWSKPITLRIQVLPPWWKTWWAYLMYVIFAGVFFSFILWAHRYRLKRKHALQLQEQQRELLMRNSEAKSQFLANLGHEIRTPMTGVLGMTELLINSAHAEQSRPQLQAIQKAGQHLLRLMNDALDLSKIEAGQFELDNQAFNVEELLLDVQELMHPLANQKGLKFELKIDELIQKWYWGDSGRIRQILINLCSNAIKFTVNGSIGIHARLLWPKGIALSVHDSGIGMNQDQQERLFQRFVQADGVQTTKRYGGTGLGLAISKELAQFMGGEIQLESQTGVGSVFTLNLPLGASDAPIPRAAVTEEIVQAPTVGLSILLVEDDEMISEVVCQLLNEMGHHTVVARNALEALAYNAQKRVEFIFCDIDLPGMNGLQLVRLLRKQGIAIPIVALSARTQEDTETLCLEAGMQALIRKPITREQLQYAITRFTD